MPDTTSQQLDMETGVESPTLEVVEDTAIDPSAEHARTVRDMIGLDAMMPQMDPSVMQANRFWGGQLVTICSVYPLPLTATFNWGGISTYHLKAAPRTGVSLLHIGDTYQNVANVVNPGRFDQTPAPITSMQAAQSLIQRWVDGSLGSGSGHSIGVAIIPFDNETGKFPNRPTPEFVRALRQRQQLYFQYLVNSADIHFNRGEFRMIGDQHRAAAQYTGATERQWYTATSQEGLKQCYGCGRRIISTAITCEHCGNNLPILYYTMGDTPPPEDKTVFAAFMKYKAKVEGGKEPRGNAFKSLVVDDSSEGMEPSSQVEEDAKILKRTSTAAKRKGK